MSFLTGLAKFFELLNSNSGGLTFLITVVYVVATIAICIANIQSANASKKQLEEMQKQYAEENRPHIEVEFLFERRSFYGLRFINHGKSTAQNVEIQLSDAFIDSLGSTNFAELLKSKREKNVLSALTNTMTSSLQMIPIFSFQTKCLQQEPFIMRIMA
jgi:hypothetical protein